MTESNKRLFPCLIFCQSEIMGRGRSRWEWRQQRVVTPSGEHISQATFSSRGSRKPDAAAVIAECCEADSSSHLMKDWVYFFITFVLSLPQLSGHHVSHYWWLCVIQPLFIYISHPCIVVVVRLMVSLALERSRPRHVEWDLFWFRCLCSTIWINLFLCGCVRVCEAEEGKVTHSDVRCMCVCVWNMFLVCLLTDCLRNSLMKFFLSSNGLLI